MADGKDKKSTVLICMDGSENADYAFNWYLKNMHHADDNVILCHVVETHTMTAMPLEGAPAVELISEMLEEQRKAAEDYLKNLVDRMKAHKLHGKVEQCHGPARSEIIRVAEDEGATAIVTGSRGLGTVKRTFLGSVSDHIVHHSHVPVLIAKLPEENKQH